MGEGGRNSKKGDTYLRQRKLKRDKFIDDEKKNYPFKILCRVMEVSISGYYAWRKRLRMEPKPRRRNWAKLVRNCYFENRRRYGVRRITASINKDGIKTGKFQVRQLMKEHALVAIRAKKFVPRTTNSKGTTASPNLLKEIKIEECAPTKIIIGDITDIPLQDGSWCYLAIWQDKVTRRIIGWSLSATMTAELVISALQKAQRPGLIKAGAIIHSDRGSQYASTDFRELLRRSGFRQSMSGKGNCYDNAQADAFLFEIQNRTDRRRSICQPWRSPPRNFYLHRRLLQSGQITFEFRLPKSNRIWSRVEN